MNTKLYGVWTVAGIVILAAFFLIIMQGRRIDQAQSELEFLKAKVAALEHNTGVVAAHPNDAEAKAGALSEQIFMAAPAAASATRKEIPPGWKPFEFNGMTYYLTPLSQEVGSLGGEAK